MIGISDTEGASITCQQFMDFYADVSMAVFDDAQFITLVSDSWKIQEAAHKQVNKKDVEQLVAAFRLKLMKQSTKNHHEEFVLRELFRSFDRTENGIVTQEILGAMLAKVDICQTPDVLEAMLIEADLKGNKNGSVEFEEFIHLVCQDRYHKR